MNKTQEALKMAIEYLELAQTETGWALNMSINACKEALAECEKAEPEGFTITGKLGDRCSFKSTTVKKGDKIYTAPQYQSAEIARLKEREAKYKLLALFVEDYRNAVGYGSKILREQFMFEALDRIEDDNE